VIGLSKYSIIEQFQKLNINKDKTMMTNKIFLIFVLFLFSNQTFAWNQGGYKYKEITGDLKPTPGCKNKEKASKKASSEYRVKKSSKVLCQHIGYGWGLAEVLDRGEVVCEPCEGEVESIDNYRCYVKNVTLKCVLTKLGW